MNDPFAPHLLSRLPQPPRKVAILRASRIGDFLCATPTFRALRSALPQAEITMITLPMLRDLALRSPHLDHYVAFPGFPGIAEQFFDPRRAIAFFQHMQAEHFDLAIQMQGSGVYSNPFILLLGAKVTSGFVRQGDPPGKLDAALPLPEHGHEIQRVLALSTFLGAPARGEETEFPLLAEDHSTAQQLLATAEPPLIGLHPSARDATRRWSLARFAATGKALLHTHGGTILILGESEEREQGELLASEIGSSCLNLMGSTSLPVLGALIQQLSVLVTNDTGPAHIAYALDTPSVTICGGASVARYRPLNDRLHRIMIHRVPCRPCEYTECPIAYLCLEAIKVEPVVEAASAILRQHTAASSARP